MRVQQIKAWDRATHIPNSPHYLSGVLNSRDTMVSVVDLRLRFGMPAFVYTSTTVVLFKARGLKQCTVGIVVDAISDIHNVLLADIKPAPDFGHLINTGFISDLVTIDNTMTMLLNIDSLLSVEALG